MKQVIKMSSLIPKFSLRSLLLGVMVCAVLTSLYVVWFMKSSEQRFLERARAEGHYLGLIAGNSTAQRLVGFYTDFFTSRKKILVEILPENSSIDFLEMATEFTFKKNLPVFLVSSGSEASPPSQLVQLLDLPNLSVIYLYCWRLPASLADLKLQTQGGLAVVLVNCELTRESLAWLLSMPNLRVLGLVMCDFEDEWLAGMEPASCNLTHLAVNSPAAGQCFYNFIGKLKCLKHFETTQIETSELNELLKSKCLDTLCVLRGFYEDSVQLLLNSPNPPRTVYTKKVPVVAGSGIDFIFLREGQHRFDLDEILTK